MFASPSHPKQTNDCTPTKSDPTDPPCAVFNYHGWQYRYIILTQSFLVSCMSLNKSWNFIPRKHKKTTKTRTFPTKDDQKRHVTCPTKSPRNKTFPTKIPGTTILQGPQRKQGTRCAKVRSHASQAAAATLAASCQVRSSFSDSEAPREVEGKW